MPNADDFSFTFDSLPFLRGIDKVYAGMNYLVKVAKSVATGISNAMKPATHFGGGGEAMTKSFKSSAMTIDQLMGKVKMLAAGYVGLKAIMAGIPELGKTFEIMGDILKRNFLWPLRKELMPYLQKLVDWARDNRTMFVRAGVVLVNIFRAVVQVVKALLNALKPVFDAIEGVVHRMMGGAKSFDEFMNILVFRLAVLAIFIVEMLKPVFTAFGSYIKLLSETVASFIEGFTDAFGDSAGTWTEIIKDFMGAWNQLWNAISGDLESGGLISFLKDVAYWFGRIAGFGIKQMIDGLTTVIRMITALLHGDFRELQRVVEEFIYRKLMIIKDFINWVGDKLSFLSGSAIGDAVDKQAAETAGRPKQEGQGLSGMMRPTVATTNKTTTISPTIRIDKVEVPSDDPEKGKQAALMIAKKAGTSFADMMRMSVNQDTVVQGR